MTKPILVGILDLMRSTRVNSTARSLGIPAITTFTTHDLLSKAHGEEASLLILDLCEERLHPLESIAELKKDEHTKSLKIVGFLTRADEELTKRAKESGCDIVVGESQFIEALPQFISGKLA